MRDTVVSLRAIAHRDPFDAEQMRKQMKTERKSQLIESEELEESAASMDLKRRSNISLSLNMPTKNLPASEQRA